MLIKEYSICNQGEKMLSVSTVLVPEILNPSTWEKDKKIREYARIDIHFLTHQGRVKETDSN